MASILFSAVAQARGVTSASGHHEAGVSQAAGTRRTGDEGQADPGEESLESGPARSKSIASKMSSSAVSSRSNTSCLRAKLAQPAGVPPYLLSRMPRIRPVLQQHLDGRQVAVKRRGVQRGIAACLIHRRDRVVLHIHRGAESNQRLDDVAGRLRGGAHDQRAPSVPRLQRVGVFAQQPLDLVFAFERDRGRERELGARLDEHPGHVALPARARLHRAASGCPHRRAFGSAPSCQQRCDRSRLVLDHGKVQRVTAPIDPVHRPLDRGRILRRPRANALDVSDRDR